MLGGGGGVAADGVPVAGGLPGAEAAGDLLLGLGGSQVTFGLVGGGRDGGAGEEPQHVGLAVVQAFEQVPGGRLLALAAGQAGDGGQAVGDGAAECRQVLRGAAGGDVVQPGVAGQVRGVDQAAQRIRGPGGPGGVRVGLGGVLEIAEQVGFIWMSR
jgi:hypothetical protein